jgi:hypothetical protein
MRIFLAMILFALPLSPEDLSDFSENPEQTEISEGLLTLHLSESVLKVELHTPLEIWLSKEIGEVIPYSDPQLLPDNLNARLGEKLSFSGFNKELLPTPEFKISESIGSSHLLIQGTDLAWSWSQPIPTAQTNLNIEWRGRIALGLWAEWAGLQQQKFLLEPMSPIKVTPPQENDFTELIINKAFFSLPKFLTLLTIFALSIFLALKARRPSLLLISLLGATLLWPFSQNLTLNEDLIKPWIQTQFQRSLLGHTPSNSSSLYDKLSTTFSGKALEEIYLEKTQNETSFAPSSQKKVSHLSVHKVEMQQGEREEKAKFSLKIDWTLSGIVQHLSHLHLRKTRHLDQVTLEVVDSELKIVSFHPIEQRSHSGGTP